MAQAKISEQEWETFLGVADRLGIMCGAAAGGCEVSCFGVGRACVGARGCPGSDGTAGIGPGGAAHRASALSDLWTDDVRSSIGSGSWRRSTGRLNFANRSAIARLVAEIFFPQRPALGLDQRSYSPAVMDKIVSANAEHKSATKAQKMLWKLAEIQVSVPLIMELSGDDRARVARASGATGGGPRRANASARICGASQCGGRRRWMVGGS